jgi:hypothetical protein
MLILSGWFKTFRYKGGTSGKRSPFCAIFTEGLGADPAVATHASTPIVTKAIERTTPQQPSKYREPDDIDWNERVWMLSAMDEHRKR